MLISITPKFLRPVTGYLVALWCAYYARSFAKICAPYIEARIRETMQAKTGIDGSRKPVVRLIVEFIQLLTHMLCP